jgi:hypothetical protein
MPYAELTVAVAQQDAGRWQQLCAALQQRSIQYEVLR